MRNNGPCCKFIILLLVSIFMIYPVFAGEETNLKRYALFIGANDGGSERVYLRYAESDALSMADVMKDIGGVDASDCRILLNPESAELSRSLEEISDWVKTTKGSANRIEFVLYYSGHSDEYGLLLKGANYPYMKLKDDINKVDADVHIAILDSCSSGSFTRLKGGLRHRPFLMDESIDTSGYAFLTSSSENEAAQESDEIEGSFFTHFLLTGLMGAADHTGNSQVSLTEAYTYASEQTLARTEQTLAGAQHPSYDMKLSGSGDLILTDLRSASAGMSISGEIAGRLFIRDNGGKLLAEINKGAGDPVTIALPPGYYTVTLENGEELSNTAISIGFNQTQRLSQDQFMTQQREWTTIRGDGYKEWAEKLAEIKTRKSLTRVPMELSFISENGDEYIVEGVAAGFIDSVNSVEGIQLGFITDLSGYLDGIQLSYIFGTVNEGMNGVQIAGVFNSLEGKTEGAQVSGVFNTAEGVLSGVQIGGVFNSQSEGLMEGGQIAGIFNDHTGGIFDGFQIGGVFNSSRGVFDGFQIGGVFNSSDGDLDGFQIAGVGNFQDGKLFNGTQIGGVLNTASGDLNGVQLAGIFNKTDDLTGFQMGLINKADDIRGSQIGLINISDSYIKGLPAGLINISRDGIRKFSAWSDSVNNAYGGFQLGTRNVYTLFFAGTTLDNTWEENCIGVGTGAHLDLNALFVEGDISAKYFFVPARFDDPGYWTEENHYVYPSLRLLAGFRIAPHLSLIGGLSADAWFPGYMNGSDYPLKESDSVETFDDWGFEISYVPRWFLGVRL